MALTDPYATPSDYREVFRNQISGASDGVLTRELGAATALITRSLGQYFGKDPAGSPSTHIWFGDGTQTLRVADALVPGIANITGLVITQDTDGDGDFGDETAVVSADYELRPVGSLSLPEPQPYTEIFLPGFSGAVTTAWYRGYRTRITAEYGWPAVPDAIWRSCIELTGIMRGDSFRATSIFTDMGDTRRASRTAQDVISDLMNVYGPGIVVA